VNGTTAIGQEPRVIDVVDVVEGQVLGWFVVRLVLVSWLVTFFDGFDMNVIAFAAPYLTSDFALDKLMLTSVFTSGIIGTLLGSILFGMLGDRLGRRRSIILATAAFGLLTLVFAAAGSYHQLVLLRFLDGTALGGVLPLTWALSVEYVPRRYRATIVTLIMMGYGIGVSAAGPISVALIPRFGWRSVFIFGGVASLLAAVLLYRALPESLRFLATRSGTRERLERIVRRLAPGRTDIEGATFVLSGQDGKARRKHSPAVLFQGPLRWITPLIWLAYASSSINTFFFTTWGPTLFEEMGLSRSTAAWCASLNSVAGAVGALVLMRFTDRIGPISIAWLPAVAVPFLVFIGFVPVSTATFIAMMALLYVFLGGSHYGIISIAGNFYPTVHRGLGTGWVSGAGKLGSIAGPWAGGLIMASSLAPQRTFAVAAICPAVFLVCMLAIGLMVRGGWAAQAE